MFTRLHPRSGPRVRVGIAIFLGALRLATTSYAQEVENPCEHFGMNAATFVARVGEQLQHRFSAGPDGPIATVPAYRVEVERAFRGVETGSTLYLAAFDAGDSLRSGQQYLIYGAFNFGLSREVVTPTRTVPLDSAVADLTFLTSQESLFATTGRIYGVVQRGSIYGQANRQALPNVTLHVRVGDFLTETTSDAQGRFDVAGLPEGFFKIEAELPPGLTGAFTGGGEVRAGGCVQTGVVAQWNGIIRGRVIGADQRPVQARLNLLSANPRVEGFPREGQTKISNPRGEFEFGVLPPGDYILGVNVNRPQSGTPHPPTYYPGTTNRAEASVIHVGEGTVLENIDLVLPSALATGRLLITPQTPVSRSSPDSNTLTPVGNQVYIARSSEECDSTNLGALPSVVSSRRHARERRERNWRASIGERRAVEVNRAVERP